MMTSDEFVTTEATGDLAHCLPLQGDDELGPTWQAGREPGAAGPDVPCQEALDMVVAPRRRD